MNHRDKRWLHPATRPPYRFLITKSETFFVYWSCKFGNLQTRIEGMYQFQTFLSYPILWWIPCIKEWLRLLDYSSILLISLLILKALLCMSRSGESPVTILYKWLVQISNFTMFSLILHLGMIYFCTWYSLGILTYSFTSIFNSIFDYHSTYLLSSLIGPFAPLFEITNKLSNVNLRTVIL